MSSRAQISRCLVLGAAIVFSPITYSQSTKSQSASSLAQAKAYIAKHDLKSAEDSIWKILSGDPNNTETILLLGAVRAEQHRYSEAETLFQRVVQLDTKAAAGHIALGNTYVAENKLAPALSQYKQAEQLSPKNTEVRITLASLYAANGDCVLAMRSLDAIPPGHFPAKAVPIRVGCLLALGHRDDAMRLAGQAKSPALALALAEVFVTAKFPREALRLLDVAAASGRKPPPRYYFVKAKALDTSGDQTGALENFERAFTLQPGSEEFALALSELYSRQGKHAEALATLQKISEVDPDSPKVLRPLIVEASFAGKSQETQAAAEQLAKSDEPQDLYVAASVFLKTGRENDAVPLLEKYVEQLPNDARAWVGLGIAYAESKRSEGAQKAFEHALEVDPKFAEAEYQLGLLSAAASDTGAATRHFERAVELNPSHTLALEKLGNVYLESGQFEKARDTLLKAEALNPKDPQVEYGLALAYSKLGNREEAKIHMEKFQKFGPIGSTEIK